MPANSAFRLLSILSICSLLIVTGCGGSSGGGGGQLPTGTPATPANPTTPSNPSTPSTPTPNPSIQAWQQEMLDQINQHRAADGKAALSWNEKLFNAAHGHTVDMRDNSFLGHTGSDGSDVSQRVSRAGYNWNTVGENVAVGQTSVTQVVTAWMNSTGHRRNILNANFKEVGFARVNNYWTQVFGRSPNSPKPQAPSAIGTFISP